MRNLSSQDYNRLIIVLEDYLFDFSLVVEFYSGLLLVSPSEIAH